MTNRATSFPSFIATAEQQGKSAPAQRVAAKPAVEINCHHVNDDVQNRATSPDRAHFSTLWQHAEIPVTRYVMSLVGRRSAADEIVQEVAYICFKQWETYEPNRDFTAWALGIARLEIFTHRRRNILLPISEIPELEALVGDPNRLIKKQSEERQRALAYCMNKLADHQKRLLEQRYGRNHSYEEMSTTLNIQINSLKAMLSLIRKILRTCINEHLTKTGRG
jgi:RNA polymerase sigma-70 factor, ECF subfamily